MCLLVLIPHPPLVYYYPIMSDAGDTTTVVSSDASSSGRILEVHGTTIDDAISWKRTADIHKHGCMRIAQRIPSLASHWKTSLGLLKPGDPDDGYRITLADVHRMYLRKLQRKLVWLAMNHQFDADRGVSTMDQWRPAIREFSTYFCRSFFYSLGTNSVQLMLSKTTSTWSALLVERMTRLLFRASDTTIIALWRT